MATVTLTAGSPAPAQAQQAADAPVRTQSLAFAQRNLEEIRTLNPAEAAKQSRYYAVMSIVVPVAIIALAAVAGTFVVIAFLPTLATLETASIGVQVAVIVLPSALAGAASVIAMYKCLQNHETSQKYHKQAQQAERRLDEHRQVQLLTPDALNASLRVLHVSHHVAPEEVDIYRALLAQHNLHIKDMNQSMEKVRKRLEKAQRAYIEGKEGDVAYHRVMVTLKEDALMKHKLRAAFVLAVMQRPDFRGCQEALIKTSNLPMIIQNLYAPYSDPRLAQHVTFPPECYMLPLSAQQVRSMQTHEIAERIVQAMPA